MSRFYYLTELIPWRHKIEFVVYEQQYDKEGLPLPGHRIQSFEDELQAQQAVVKYSAPESEKNLEKQHEALATAILNKVDILREFIRPLLPRQDEIEKLFDEMEKVEDLAWRYHSCRLRRPSSLDVTYCTLDSDWDESGLMPNLKEFM